MRNRICIEILNFSCNNFAINIVISIMKTKTALFAASIAAASLSVLGAEDSGVIASVDAARGFSASAVKSYNNALTHVRGANTVLDADYERALGISERFRSLLSASDGIASDVSAEFSNAKMIEERFTQTCDFLNSAKVNLEAASSSFPLGEKRVALGLKLNSQMGEIASKNPGDMYQDRNYFLGVSGAFMAAKNQLQSSQDSLSKALIDLSIANPRIEGIKSTVALARDFLSKAEASSGKNMDEINGLKSAAESLLENSISRYSELSALTAAMRVAKTKYVAAEISLTKFIMNDLAASEKYGSHIFKPSPEYFIKAVQPVLQAPSAQYQRVAKMKKDAGDAAMFGAVPQKAFGNSSWEMAAGSVNSRAKPASASGTKNVRSELLELGASLTNLSAEIMAASGMLESISEEARKAISEIESIEQLSQALLRRAIDLSTSSQMAGSDIEIFRNNLKVAKVQSDVASSEFKKLCESADNCLKACSADTESLVENLKKADEAL